MMYRNKALGTKLAGGVALAALIAFTPAHSHASEEGSNSEYLDESSEVDTAEAETVNEPGPEEPGEIEDDYAVEAAAQPVDIKYVPMPDPSKPRNVTLGVVGSMNHKGILRSIAANMKEFVQRNSRGKIQVVARTGPVGSISGKGRDRYLLVYKPGAASRVPIIGNAVTAKHELGHELGSGHANTRIWGTQATVKQSNSQKDPFDPMTISPGVVSFNAAHLHWLKYFSPTEEAFAEVGKEYTLKIVNTGSRDFSSLKALYYEVPGTTRKMWFSYVKVSSKGWRAPDGMPGTAVAIHSASGGSSFLEGLIGLDEKTNIRSGLILKLSQATATSVKVKVMLDPNWKLEQ